MMTPSARRSHPFKNSGDEHFTEPPIRVKPEPVAWRCQNGRLNYVTPTTDREHWTPLYEPEDACEP